MVFSSFSGVLSLPKDLGSSVQWVSQSVRAFLGQGQKLINLPKTLEGGKKQIAKKQAQVDDIQRIVEAIYNEKPVGKSFNQMR